MKFTQDTVQTRWSSPLGEMILAATPLGLCGAWFHDQEHLPPALPWPMAPEHPVLQAAQTQLSAYFAGAGRGAHWRFDLPMDLSGGTPFQQDVWCALLALPHGQTTSYSAVSAASGHANAVRAVGGAIGRNPISIIVPCHRVVGKSGALTGYAGGLQRKSHLLALEATH